MIGDPVSGRGARHVALPSVGESGQRAIEDATVLIVGVGGIGCAAASYLVSSGVGHLILNDFDTVDATNLGRQILFGPDDIGKLKAERAAAALRRINPDVRLTTVTERMDDKALTGAAALSDVVLDGTDNFQTRFRINDACVASNRVLVSGAAIRMEAQLCVFGPDYTVSPCYRCLYSEADESLEDCAGNGVLAPIPGVIGTLMATEALKALTGNKPAVGKLSLYDGSRGDWRSVSIRKRTSCESCAAPSDVVQFALK